MAKCSLNQIGGEKVKWFYLSVHRRVPGAIHCVPKNVHLANINWF